MASFLAVEPVVEPLRNPPIYRSFSVTHEQLKEVLGVTGWRTNHDRSTETETVEAFMRHLDKAWNIDSASDPDMGASRGSSP